MKKLTKLYKSFNDKSLHEYEEPKQTSNREEEVKIEIPGVEGETLVKIKFGEATGPLEDVTITFMSGDDEVEQYADLDFEEYEMIEDHENEGQDWIFVAEGDGMTFEVEVQVEAGYEQSGAIQQVDWETLTVTYDDEGEPLDEGCTEEQIKEGTCGYAPGGEVDVNNTDKMTPAGPDLIKIKIQEVIKKELKKLKK